jgi:hypothetical protein
MAMKQIKLVAISQNAPEHNYRLISILAWASVVSICASVSLIAAAIFIQ